MGSYFYNHNITTNGWVSREVTFYTCQSCLEICCL